MSDRVQGGATGSVAAVPRPQAARPRPVGMPPGSGRVQLQRSGACRATVRDALDAALRGVRLGGRERQFLGRLVSWDKRNAAAVASLLWRARQAGRSEVALSARQLEVVLAALGDAAAYRASGAGAAGCWDCGNIPGGRCADHARDADRARACTELAEQIAAGAVGSVGSAGVGAADAAVPAELTRLTDISGFCRRTSVAS
jgi:hypothetical protein